MREGGVDFDRRGVLFGAAAAGLTPLIARAAAIDAHHLTGTIADVEHVVILMQENRAFDHYFGEMNGVRGFGDRFPIPLAEGRTVWTQAGRTGGPAQVAPFPLNTEAHFEYMRVEGTPHNWFDAQTAWDEGRMSAWPRSKTERAMGHYRRQDIPFQYALADAFTVCDAYHASIQSGTNSNRLFLWTGTNDPLGQGGGPAITNSHDNLATHGGHPDGYRWSTYAERLLAAGVSWRIYQDMADNFTDNPVAGFKTFRDSHAAAPGSDPRLAALGLSTRALDGLREDVVAARLPQVSYIVAPAADSEHPAPSSPAQGADYTARVLEALTANPAVWARTVLLLMYDENDGFFDHMPPPAPPSVVGGAAMGGSTVDTTGEYHIKTTASETAAERPDLMGRPYGLGPRVPMIVISPWSRGGWVNSQVFDHTSVIRFLEQRFGVREPNISPWRRAVCGDLTSAFDFKTPNHRPGLAEALPATRPLAARAAALPHRTTPTTPATPEAPSQARGPRPSRALPYALEVAETAGDQGLTLAFRNPGRAAAVVHVYDRRRLEQVPRRYTVGPGAHLDGVWQAGAYDLWVLGPNGFHRHFAGDTAQDPVQVSLHLDAATRAVRFAVHNAGAARRRIEVRPEAYADRHPAWTAEVEPGHGTAHAWSLSGTGGWYDLALRVQGEGGYLRRCAGRLETGRDSISDPAMGGTALMSPFSV